jgi:hypothetical protein
MGFLNFASSVNLIAVDFFFGDMRIGQFKAPLKTRKSAQNIK